MKSAESEFAFGICKLQQFEPGIQPGYLDIYLDAGTAKIRLVWNEGKHCCEL